MSTAQEFKSITVPFEVKHVSEDGQFVGFAAVYGNIDLGGDVIERGAFTKTLQENADKVPLMSEHKVPIGISSLEDSEFGLKSTCMLNLEKQVARDLLADVKFYQNHGKPLGMSVGYLSIPDKTEFKNGVRYLKEVKLFENTVTIMPMNPGARVVTVKSLHGLKRKSDFSEEFTEAQLMSQPSMMIQALCCALCDTIYDAQLSDEEKVALARDAVSQFGDAYVGMLPDYLALQSDQTEKSTTLETKYGRRISKDTATRLNAAMDRHRAAMDDHKKALDEIQALLDEAAGDGTLDKSGAALVVPPEPVPDHSAMFSKIDELKGVFQWNLSNKN